jgi:DNA-binding CsgD family transcriptional regulator/PAS domain-containing protein
MRAGAEELVEAIYSAALDPDGWAGVMDLMKRRFATNGAGLYFLDFQPRVMRKVHVDGISESWQLRFDDAYFTPDNPWCIHSARLHRPGVVRTNERLARFTRDSQILYRSQYYNEWMRPQRFRYTIGNTMLAEQGTVANLTLLRPPDGPTFAAAEVREFERLSVHMTRALQVAVQLERAAEQRERGARAFDELAHGVAMVDARAQLLYANVAAEAVLRRRAGLAVRDGVLRTAVASEQGKLDALLRAVLPDREPLTGDAPASTRIRGAAGEALLVVNAVRVVSGPGRYLPSRPAVLLTFGDPAPVSEGGEAALKRAFGMTPNEAKLAIAVAGGASVRQAAEQLGITYGTARSYLKILFRKTDCHRQSQLVARVIGSVSGRP